MSKIYQQLEQIFKFRILSNDEIPSYLKRMSLIGKIDEVKTQAIFNLILTRLGEIEDYEAIPAPIAQEEPPLTFDSLDRNVQSVVLDSQEILKGFPCPDCDFVAKSALGLQSHSRKHKK